MDARFRTLFNSQFTPELYESYQRELSQSLGATFEFRLAESPVFLPDDFKAKAVAGANAILGQLSDPENLERMKRAIPARWDTPGMDALPNFAQVDFAVVRDADGTLVPKLIELQGFPSLTALQVAQRDAWTNTLAKMDGLDVAWSCWFSGYDREAFLDLARRTIVGMHDSAEVVLLDIEPARQKTYTDFAATKKFFGVDAVDPRELTKRGDQLFRGGTRVRRIYNRIVFDELEKRQIDMPFDYRDPLDVEWAPHPNWYWVWSKYSLPFLRHESVPRATFLSDLDAVPDDLSRFVLKPLFSFAGGGVKIEIRMMFLRPDDEPKPILAQNLIRLSRGKMLGVDFNKQFTWVGSSIGLSLTS